MGRLKRGVVIDWETSGLRDDRTSSINYIEGPQGIEIGAIVVDLNTWEEIATFESRVRFIGSHNDVQYGGPFTEKLTWSVTAERIHGLTPAMLSQEPGPLPVAVRLFEFFETHLQGEPIYLIGQNPNFDSYFTKQLFFLASMLDKVRFYHRMLDTHTAGSLVLGAGSSDELFQLVASTKRDYHSAIEDARLTLIALRAIVGRLRAAGFGVPSAIQLPTTLLVAPWP